MSEILVQRNFPRSALNQLSWCFTAKSPGWERVGQLPEEFRTEARHRFSSLKRTLKKAPSTDSRSVEWRLPEPDRKCDVCGALFSSAGAACALCGTLHPAGTVNCEMCGYDVIRWENLPFCPICRNSFALVQGHRLTCQIIPRGPGRKFSVLWPQANPGSAER
jgi:rubrerythrin